MKIKIRLKDLMLIILLTIVFSSTISATGISATIGYYLLLLLCMWSLLNYFYNMRKNEEINKMFCAIIKGNFVIKLLIHCYTIGLVIFGLTESRFLSSNMQTYINAISAFCIFYLFRERTLTNSLIAIFFSFIVAVITQYGTGYIAVHDISFAVEYVLIYFLVIQDRITKKNFKWIVLIGSVLYIANKEIQILGFIAIILLHLVIKNFKECVKKRIFSILTIVFISLIYVYVYIVIEGTMFELIDKYKLFTSGREYYYQVAKEICEFSIDFLGYGRNALQVLFGNEYSYLRVGNIHSDVLRMYSECGFILFSAWIINYFYLFPRIICTKFGMKAREGYMYLTYFTFITYFTDNTELYIMAQYFYILMIIYTIIYSNYSDKKNI